MLELAKKELIERAARPSTYWTRVLNASLLVILFLSVEGARTTRSFFPISGEGANLFYKLVWTQWAAILIFVPLTMAGSIANERHRGTWDLLKLTDLRPWEIIGQKFASGMLPIVTGILLLAPLGAMAFSAGGLETGDIWLAILSLTFVAMFIGAIGMMCSTLTRSATPAILLVYLITAAFLLIPQVSPATSLRQLQSGERDLLIPLLGQAALALVFLTAAGRWLLRPPFERDAHPRSPLAWLRRRLAGPKASTDHPLLDESPVAWRELKRHSLHHWSSYLKIAAPFVIVVIGIALCCHHLPTWQARVIMPRVNYTLWIGSALILALMSANMVVRERSEQTLAILLTTPIQSGALIKQKSQAIRRVSVICSLVIASSAIISVITRSGLNPWFYLPNVLCGLILYFPMISWIGFIVGARSQNGRRATLAVFLVLTVVLGLPFVSFLLPFFIGFNLVSPSAYIFYNEVMNNYKPEDTVFVVIHYILIAAATLGLRHVAVWFANSWLGRTKGSAWLNTEEAPPPDQSEDAY